MEEKETITVNHLNALGHFKVLNKLGTIFFILFIVSAFMPFATDFITDASLYARIQPTFLIFIALIAAVVFVTGVSRNIARGITILFIIISLFAISSLGEQTSQLNSLFGTGNTSSLKAGWIILKESIVTTADSRTATTFKFSPSLILMLIAFLGILGCTFSPRYKENKALIAFLTSKEFMGQATMNDDSDSPSTNVAVDAQTTGEANVSIKAKLDILGQKAVVIAKNTDTLFDKASKTLCDKKAELNHKHVKIALYSVTALLIWLILF